MSDSGEDKKGRFNSNHLGAGMLVVAFVVSSIVATINTLRVESPNRNVIRIAHWQLEQGYRSAMQEVIEEYQKLNPGVEIEQMPVTERVYAQWLNTHLISGTAPDICELGFSNLATKDEYTVRYFLPLSNVSSQPNPYNADNEMRDVPWKETLQDGMRGGFREGLQEYFGVPTTFVSMRIFYNKKLLKAATGSDAAPATFGQWMSQCQAIDAYGKQKGKKILPIVSTNTVQGTLSIPYEVAFTANYEEALDLDLDGTILPMEVYIGYRTGKVSMDDPAIQAYFKTVRAVGEQMGRGFSSIDRQTAQFKFVNETAGFLWTGSWDASGTVAMAAEKGFEVGVFELPLPGPGEPYAEFIRGKANEASSSGAGSYGVYKNSKKSEQAIDFLMFLTSRRGNELLNQKAEWPTLTIGAKSSELMKPFQPNPRGYNARVNFNYGSRVGQVFNSRIVNYYQGDEPFSAFKAAYEEVIVDPRRGGDWAWWNEQDQRRRDIRNKERVLAQDTTLELINPGSRDQNRYRRALLQQVTRNNALDFYWLFRKHRQMEPAEAWAEFQPVFP
jgi:raffinose/stachyose/melibiose transport system substrate-binding protein